MSIFDDVREFHRTFDLPKPQELDLYPSFALIELRVKLIKEEVQKELLPALEKLKTGEDQEDTMVEVADGIVDSIVVLIGCAVSFGIPIEKVWNEVHRSNMAKVGPDGTVIRREDGKVLKPPGWKNPDIRKALGFKPYPYEETVFVLRGNVEERKEQLQMLQQRGWKTTDDKILLPDNGVEVRAIFRRSAQ